MFQALRTSQSAHLFTRGVPPILRPSPRLGHLRSISHYQPAPVIMSSRKLSTSTAMMHDSSRAANTTDDSTGTRGPGTFDDVIARSKKSSEIQKIALELPEIPRTPNRRTLHIKHEDLETHVRPLLSCHWHVGHVGRGVHGLEVLSINKLYNFKDFRSAVEFFDALADIQDEEDHHARVIVDYSNVYISVHSHVAFQPISSATGESKPIKVPGLTNRDVRFAIKSEKLHQKFLEDQRAVTKVPAESTRLQEWSMERLRQRYPASHPQDMRKIEKS